MALVLLADDAYFFMVAWEAMALSSFFLVTRDHRHAEIRRTGYLYILIAHIGALSILLSTTRRARLATAASRWAPVAKWPVSQSPPSC